MSDEEKDLTCKKCGTSLSYDELLPNDECPVCAKQPSKEQLSEWLHKIENIETAMSMHITDTDDKKVRGRLEKCKLTVSSLAQDIFAARIKLNGSDKKEEWHDAE